MLEGFQNREAVLESGRGPDFLIFWENHLKRLQFILSTLAAVFGGLIGTKSKASRLAEAPKMMTWAERIAQESAKTNSRRYEHWIQARLCTGEYDRNRSPDVVAERKARCAKICGLCRYINSLAVWPVPHYQRPPENYLNALAEQPYCFTYRSEPPYNKIPRG